MSMVKVIILKLSSVSAFFCVNFRPLFLLLIQDVSSVLLIISEYCRLTLLNVMTGY